METIQGSKSVAHKELIEGERKTILGQWISLFHTWNYKFTQIYNVID